MNRSPLRFITAASLFDGHDAAINIIRRLIQARGCEVIHLGHNRGVDEIVRAAIQEDADAIALSSYQGGHMEFFTYLIDRLKEVGAKHIVVIGGGGGTITREEIDKLQDYGVERIYHPRDGLQMGLSDMVKDAVQRVEKRRIPRHIPEDVEADDDLVIGRTLSMIENGLFDSDTLTAYSAHWRQAGKHTPVIGITGTGGSGKSSLVDELLLRFHQYLPEVRVAVLAIDPSRRRTGGALLGDRIRMNSLGHGNAFMRSMATRRRHLATSETLLHCIDYLKATGFGLVMVETAGIGQSDSEIVDLADHSVYVMTSDFGAASQLEKIDMLDLADSIVINKFDQPAARDALRDVRRQWRRNHNEFTIADAEIPVFPTVASQFNDPGVSRLFHRLSTRLDKQFPLNGSLPIEFKPAEPQPAALIPASRTRYLSEIAEQGRRQRGLILAETEAVNRAQHFYESLRALNDPELPAPLHPFKDTEKQNSALRNAYNRALESVGPDGIRLLQDWPDIKQSVQSARHQYKVRDQTIDVDNYGQSLSHLPIPKIAVPDFESWGELLKFLRKEHLPGHYPYTAGVYPYRRSTEDPTRMFAGEGTPERTNRRFHYITRGQSATRLSTAFDSVTLYGEDPALRPDVYGKIGNSGVSIATLDDMKKLYSGFDLCADNTSVSMTINGPAPIILAFFMNAAIDQQVERYLKETGHWHESAKMREEILLAYPELGYHGELPDGNNSLGLGLLGISGDKLVDEKTYAGIKAETLSKVRGTVQADILKEDQAQNTCIFSTEFALHMMGDIQQYFIDHDVRNFYSVSISGYHIAEAGANPVTQLAFTLANGFTLAEYYLSRGMDINRFAPNLSFFFSNGMDPEYSVIGRVARRIWARAMRERYGADARSQMLKYHIQTSGRSLHSQEIQFNDIRTTLQALYALFDNCNSLHTNAYDEALTTPTEASVRRAVAIQLIINKELGLNMFENPWQGSFAIDYLTDLVEEAVFQEFDRLSERGGVLGAMDSMYQRGRIQQESMHYEQKKHDGSLPIIGVNTFKGTGDENGTTPTTELMRSSDAEKQQQVRAVRAFRALHQSQKQAALQRLQTAAQKHENTFAALMDTVKYCSLGEITHALYRVGGEYRRNM